MVLKNPIITKGTKGLTVCYKLKNIRIENGILKWDESFFYTPVGDLVDENGDNYFIIPTKEYIIPDRDSDVDIELQIKLTKVGGVEARAAFVGATVESIELGLEGDVVIFGIIPHNISQEIEITPREVTE